MDLVPAACTAPRARSHRKSRAPTNRCRSRRRHTAANIVMGHHHGPGGGKVGIAAHVVTMPVRVDDVSHRLVGEVVHRLQKLRRQGGKLVVDEKGPVLPDGQTNGTTAAFQGVKIDEFPVGAETYEVNLRVAASDRLGPEDLVNFTVMGRDQLGVGRTDVDDLPTLKIQADNR